MRTWAVLLAAATAGLAAVPDTSEACGRRRCRQAACPQPYYAWTPCQPAVLSPGWAPPGYAYPSAAAGRRVTIKGWRYWVIPTDERGENEVEELEPPAPALLKSAAVPAKDAFHGTARRVAKTNIFKGDPKSFDSISALRAWLPSDDVMAALDIGRGPAVNRVAQEQFNVTVPAFIYAFRKESDHDYHVIFGDAPGTADAKYLNGEVSGIPVAGTDENRNSLWDVRREFKQKFDLGDDGPDSYDRLPSPVPVRVTGSLFWDVEHPPPHTVGPSFASPKTAWEIHPISSIEWLE